MKKHPDTWTPWSLLSICLIALSLSNTSIEASEKPLNVLFIVVDDLNDWVGALGGHPQAKTPHLDQFVKNGALVFDQAHCPATVCGPSRSALLSGVRPSNTGLYGNGNNMKHASRLKDNLTITEYFSKHGYHTMSTGKIFHKHPSWKGMDEGQWAFDEWESIGGGGKLPKSKTPYNQLPMPDGSWPKGKLAAFDWLATDLPMEKTGDFAAAQWAGKRMASYPPQDKPFFMALGISKPHTPWYVPKKFFDMHPLDSIELADMDMDDLADIKNAKGKNKFKPHINFERVQKYNKFKEATQAYLAAVSYADECIGEALNALENSPHKDNTMVVIFSDHGWFLGEKLQFGKTNLWDESTRVPLLIKVPNLTPADTHTSAVVNLIDLYPTLVEMCSLPANPNIDGLSFAPVLKDSTTPWNKPTLTTIQFQNHSIRDERYRYTRYSDGTEEFYDHSNDPLERNNLISNPEISSLVQTYKSHLPSHDEPETGEMDIDKNRFKRTLKVMAKMGKNFAKMGKMNQLDPKLVKKVYSETK
jgi:arylsulfatase A-like enzyme